MKTIIIAGGLGTRLKSVLPDLPKSMANIAGKPFLEYLILQLKTQGIKDVVLAVGYKAECIKDYFKDGKNLGMNIVYSCEDAPLGTGGAVKKAFLLVEDEYAVVINGDSIFDINIDSLVKSHLRMKANITIASKRVSDSSRYGSIVIDSIGNIIRFSEKALKVQDGLINTGIYCINENVANSIPDGNLSLERDIFPKWINKGLKSVAYDGYFVDIGLPESLAEICNNPVELLRIGHLKNV